MDKNPAPPSGPSAAMSGTPTSTTTPLKEFTDTVVKGTATALDSAGAATQTAMKNTGDALAEATSNTGKFFVEAGEGMKNGMTGVVKTLGFTKEAEPESAPIVEADFFTKFFSAICLPCKA